MLVYCVFYSYRCIPCFIGMIFPNWDSKNSGEQDVFTQLIVRPKTSIS